MGTNKISLNFILFCLYRKKEERPNATELLKNEFPAKYMPEYEDS